MSGRSPERSWNEGVTNPGRTPNEVSRGRICGWSGDRARKFKALGFAFALQALGDKAGVVRPMSRCGLVTAGDCGSLSECTGNPVSAAVSHPDCGCGSVGSWRMINRAAIRTSSHNRRKRSRHGRQRWEERQGKEQATAGDETEARGAEAARQSPSQEDRSRNRVTPLRFRPLPLGGSARPPQSRLVVILFCRRAGLGLHGHVDRSSSGRSSHSFGTGQEGRGARCCVPGRIGVLRFKTWSCGLKLIPRRKITNGVWHPGIWIHLYPSRGVFRPWNWDVAMQNASFEQYTRQI